MRLILFICASILGHAVHAQAKNSLNLSINPAHGSEAGIDGGGIGVNFGLEYFIWDGISFAPNYTAFFESEEEFIGGVERSYQLANINLDGRYYFSRSRYSMYGMGGVVLAKAVSRFEDPQLGESESATDEVAFNIGTGFLYVLSERFSLNGQSKFQTFGEAQIVVQVGVALVL